MRTFYRFGLAGAFLACLTNFAHAVDDGRGKDWQLLTGFSLSGRVTWEQAAAVCPTDGLSACTGRLGQVAMKDWVWATSPQLSELFGSYAPANPDSPVGEVGGNDLLAAATRFQTQFGVTQHLKGCVNYICFNSRFTTGMTASVAGRTAPATPIGGEVIADLEFSSGSFRNFSPMQPDVGRGLWVWRPTGLGTPGAHAYDDAASPSVSGAGVAVADVLANDWVAGQRASLSNASLALVSSSVAGVWLDTSSGAVRVEAGTDAGSYDIVYRVCNLAHPDHCDDATVTVTVKSFPQVANPDVGALAIAAGGRAIANVLANDSVGGVVATLASVQLTTVSSTHPGVTLNTATGAVDVAPGTPHGRHVLTYRICERARLANCVQSSATVAPFVIDAVSKSASASSKTGGVAIADVLVNDSFNGAPATLAQVTLSLPARLPTGISLDTATGALTVAPKTPSGTYVVSYTICERLSPANCDTATLTLDLRSKLG